MFERLSMHAGTYTVRSNITYIKLDKKNVHGNKKAVI